MLKSEALPGPKNCSGGHGINDIESTPYNDPF